MSKKERRRRYGDKFKREAVARMAESSNIAGLARQLGIDAKMLYQWKWQQEGRPTRKPLPLTTQAAKLGGCGDVAAREPASEAGLGGEGAGSGFFQRCLAEGRGSTSESRRLWRDAV